MECRGSCRFEHVVVELTEACNNACLHCYNYWDEERQAVGGAGELSRADIRSLIRQIRRDMPLRRVGLSGGEPTLRDDLPDIVADLADEGLNSVVITNGALLGHALLKRFPEGTVFQVTLFSADAERHDRMAGRRVFDCIVENLVRVEQHRCRFALVCVVTRHNAHDVLRTIQLGIALGANVVQLNRINLSRHVLPMADELVPSAAMLRQSLDGAEHAAQKYGVAVAVSVPVPPCVVEPADYPHLHFGWCPRGGRDAYYTVGHTGLVRPCNHSSLVLGDVRRERFVDLVSGQEARRFWEPVPPECLECEHPLKDACRGGCPAAAEECYGTRQRVDPFVNFAME